jgi:hypothetical protein
VLLRARASALGRAYLARLATLVWPLLAINFGVVVPLSESFMSSILDQVPVRSGRMAAMTANSGDDLVRSRDLARLRELTSPHLPHPGAPIGPALLHMTPDDRAETIAILGRLGDPREGAIDDGT